MNKSVKMRPVTQDRNNRRIFNNAIGDTDKNSNPYASMYQQAFGKTDSSNERKRHVDFSRNSIEFKRTDPNTRFATPGSKIKNENKLNQSL